MDNAVEDHLKENNSNAGKKVLLAVTGSIAAYKSVTLLRLLQDRGFEVQIMATAAALNFVGNATWEGLTGTPAATDIFQTGGMLDHIHLVDAADIMVIAPATANTLANLASGRAGDLISSSWLASRCPTLIAPAMNVNMWNNIRTQTNISTLQESGVAFVDPDSGALACGWEGAGRLADPALILLKIEELLSPKPLAGKKILVTAGATREYLDPVRFLSNPSSGIMGVALAMQASQLGAEVTLIAGESAARPAALPDNLLWLSATSAKDMMLAAQTHFAQSDWMIAAAAVADWSCQPATQKQKKEGDTLTLDLHRTPDILKTLSLARRADQKTIGFAAETEKLLEHGAQKLKDKKLDAILCNDVSTSERGFSARENAGTLLFENGEKIEFSLQSKSDLARSILTTLIEKWSHK